MFACFQVVEQLVILFLHCVLMAGMSFQLELANDFWPELHCTRNKEIAEPLGISWLRWPRNIVRHESC